MENDPLIERAHSGLHLRQLSEECTVSEVGAAYGIGYCGETAAIAQMVTAGETRVARIVAVSSDGRLLPPCGRCRE